MLHSESRRVIAIACKAGDLNHRLAELLRLAEEQRALEAYRQACKDGDAIVVTGEEVTE